MLEVNGGETVDWSHFSPCQHIPEDSKSPNIVPGHPGCYKDVSVKMGKHNILLSNL